MAILISCQELSKTFGARPLFQGLSFGLFEGERTGLIGPNGTGKSTLLKILAGAEALDGGTLAPRRGLRVGYLAQQDRVEEAPPGLTVRGRLDAALAGLGLTLLPEDELSPHLQDGSLVRVLQDWCPPFDGFSIYYPTRRQMRPALRAFVDFFRYRPQV